MRYAWLKGHREGLERPKGLDQWPHYIFYNIAVAVNISIGIAWLWRFILSPFIFLGQSNYWEYIEGKPWAFITNLRRIIQRDSLHF